MLNSLSRLEPEVAERVLSSVTLSLVPKPGIEYEVGFSEILGDVEEQVLGETRQRLKLSASDTSDQARIKVLELLSKEMSNSVLGRADEALIKARLGQRGDLRSDLYEVKFEDPYHKEFVKLGTRPLHVEQAIHRPDDVEHLLEGVATETDKDAFSLYLKAHRGRTSRDDFTLLVQTRRQGYKQLVLAVWRVYHSDVDLSRVRKALDILRAFVEVYGLRIQVGNSLPAKFVVYESMPLARDQERTSVVTIVDEKSPKGHASCLLRVSTLGVLEVAIAYAINMSKYIADLKKHKVMIS